MGKITSEIKEFTPKEFQKFYEKMKEAIVYISSFSDDGSETCFLGTYISSDGLILTNASKISVLGKRIKLLKVKGTQTRNKSVVVEVVHWNFVLDMVLLKDRNSKEEYNHVALADVKDIEKRKQLVILTSLAAKENLSQVKDDTVAPELSLHVGTVAFPCEYQGGDVERCRYLRDVLPSSSSIVTSLVSGYMPLIEMTGMHACEQSVGAPIFNKYGRMVGMYYFSRTCIFSERVPYDFFEPAYKNKLPKSEYAIHGKAIHMLMEKYNQDIRGLGDRSR